MFETNIGVDRGKIAASYEHLADDVGLATLSFTTTSHSSRSDSPEITLLFDLPSLLPSLPPKLRRRERATGNSATTVFLPSCLRTSVEFTSCLLSKLNVSGRASSSISQVVRATARILPVMRCFDGSFRHLLPSSATRVPENAFETIQLRFSKMISRFFYDVETDSEPPLDPSSSGSLLKPNSGSGRWDIVLFCGRWGASSSIIRDPDDPGLLGIASQFDEFVNLHVVEMSGSERERERNSDSDSDSSSGRKRKCQREVLAHMICMAGSVNSSWWRISERDVGVWRRRKRGRGRIRGSVSWRRRRKNGRWRNGEEIVNGAEACEMCLNGLVSRLRRSCFVLERERSEIPTIGVPIPNFPSHLSFVSGSDPDPTESVSVSFLFLNEDSEAKVMEIRMGRTENETIAPSRRPPGLLECCLRPNESMVQTTRALIEGFRRWMLTCLGRIIQDDQMEMDPALSLGRYIEKLNSGFNILAEIALYGFALDNFSQNGGEALHSNEENDENASVSRPRSPLVLVRIPEGTSDEDRVVALSLLGRAKRALSEFSRIVSQKERNHIIVPSAWIYAVRFAVGRLPDLPPRVSSLVDVWWEISSSLRDMVFRRLRRRRIRRQIRCAFDESCPNWRSSFEKNGECFFVGYRMDFGARLSVDHLSPRNVFDRPVRSGVQLVGLQAYVESYRGLPRKLDCFNWSLPSSIPDFLFPIFVSPTHWSVASRLLPRLAAPLSAIFGQNSVSTKSFSSVVPFLLLSFSLRRRERLESPFLIIRETCLRLYDDLFSSGSDVHRLARRFLKFATSVQVRSQIPNTEAFLAQVFCGILKKDVFVDRMLWKDEFFLHLVEEELRRKQSSLWASYGRLPKRELMEKLLGVEKTHEIDLYLHFLRSTVAVERGYDVLPLSGRQPLYRYVQSLARLCRRNDGRVVDIEVVFRRSAVIIQLTPMGLHLVGPNTDFLLSLPHQRKFVQRMGHHELLLLSEGHRILLRIVRLRLPSGVAKFQSFPSLAPIPLPLPGPSSPLRRSMRASKRGGRWTTTRPVRSSPPFVMTSAASDAFRRTKQFYDRVVSPLFLFKESFVDDYIFVPKKNTFAFLGISPANLLALLLQNLLMDNFENFARFMKRGLYQDPFEAGEEILRDMHERLDCRKQIDGLLNRPDARIRGSSVMRRDNRTNFF